MENLSPLGLTTFKNVISSATVVKPFLGRRAITFSMALFEAGKHCFYIQTIEDIAKEKQQLVNKQISLVNIAYNPLEKVFEELISIGEFEKETLDIFKLSSSNFVNRIRSFVNLSLMGLMEDYQNVFSKIRGENSPRVILHGKIYLDDKKNIEIEIIVESSLVLIMNQFEERHEIEGFNEIVKNSLTINQTFLPIKEFNK